MTAADTWLIRGGRIVDPGSGRDEVGDLFVADGKIAPLPDPVPPTATVIDAKGLVVTPGLIDIHVHLREPGGDEAETIASGTRAAARGGFTAIVSMPNTRPATDSPDLIRETIRKADEAGFCRVWPSGCVSVDRAGKELADLDGMAAAGAIFFTDDGSTVGSEALLEAAMTKALALGRPIVDHAQDSALESRGCMHEGDCSRRWNLPGIPAVAETMIVERNIRAAERTGCPIHIQHLTAGESLPPIAAARARGVPITAELSPHHLALCDDDIDPADARYKMNPPLRTAADRDALAAAVCEGAVQCFATDHAPHTAAEKARGFVDAPFGIVGLETAVGVTYSAMVKNGPMDLATWLRRWTIDPAAIIGVAPPSLAVGAAADIAILDLESEWTVDPERFLSTSRNTPFSGWTLTGQAVCTLLAGRMTWGIVTVDES